jgi:ORF6N domain
MENEKWVKRAKSSIYTIRNVPVMLDKDLALLYGASTARLNEQVRRNPSRFPPSFCFQLNKNELMDWMSQNAISKSERMGMRKCPFVFTEYGATMVSSVLKSTSAVQVSIHLFKVLSTSSRR